MERGKRPTEPCRELSRSSFCFLHTAISILEMSAAASRAETRCSWTIATISSFPERLTDALMLRGDLSRCPDGRLRCAADGRERPCEQSPRSSGRLTWPAGPRFAWCLQPPDSPGAARSP